MQTRPSWLQYEQHSQNTSLFDFKWAPVSSQIKFDFLGKHGTKSLVNHFESHECLSHKDLLYANLQKHCELIKHKSICDIVPLTFIIDFTNRFSMDQALDKFAQCFQAIEGNKSEPLSVLNTKLAKRKIKPIAESMLDGQNMWVIKPADYNRGRGVVIANRLDEVRRIINESFSDTKPNDEVKSDLFVIQKYIEKPLLIDGRKFDMRVWVLVTHEFECYVFAEGYVRLSSYPFSLAPEQIDSLAVHLTNNAI